MAKAAGNCNPSDLQPPRPSSTLPTLVARRVRRRVETRRATEDPAGVLEQYVEDVHQAQRRRHGLIARRSRGLGRVEDGRGGCRSEGLQLPAAFAIVPVPQLRS